ncbi:MAG: oxygenase MpaB family protein, partial [Acidimicrobiales bacterium]
MIGNLKDRVVESTTSLFSHGPQPLEHTLDYAGDPGLLGPDSVSWRVIGDAAAFVGGIRALLVQTAHPEVVAGVEQHSRYRADPLGRLSRTSVYVTETTYGAMPEVEAAIEVVRGAHVPVRGRSERDKPYSAAHPEMAAWVHNVLTNSFLTAYQAYGPDPLTRLEADRFVAEQTRIGALLDASPLPETADELGRWVADHPALASSQAQRKAIEFLRDPPLPLPVKLGYRLLFNAAVATLPPTISGVIGLRRTPGGGALGRVSVGSLRWALGSSPSSSATAVRTSWSPMQRATGSRWVREPTSSPHSRRRLSQSLPTLLTCLP